VYKTVACETLDYILRDMTDFEGGFHSAEDADSEGVEGKFYVWSWDEIHEVLGASAAERFCYVYNVTEGGNFEGQNILNLPKSIQQCANAKHWDLEQLRDELATSREKLLDRRTTRIRPGKDDKVIVSWNGLTIEAMARAASVFDRDDYRNAAIRAATLIREKVTDDDGRLLHTYRQGVAKLPAYLDDYACLVNSLVSLYEATFDESWLNWGVSLMETVLARFQSEAGTFYFTAEDHEQLITRTIDMHDSSVPSGNAMAATALIRLGKICSRLDFVEAAARIVRAAVPIMQAAPSASGQMLVAADMLLEPFYEIVIMGGKDATTDEKLLRTIRSRYLPNTVIGYRIASSVVDADSVVVPLFEGRGAADDEVTTYICQDQACESPLVGLDRSIERIQKMY
jgi:uncharacterized protein YyaL (SSP411 family)